MCQRPLITRVMHSSICLLQIWSPLLGSRFALWISIGKTDVAALDQTKPFMPIECTCAGVYLCIKAYGEVNLTYALRATLSDCPADFSAAGQQLLCSSPVDGDASQQRYTQCAADGTCVCKPPYDKPVEDVYPCEHLLCTPPHASCNRGSSSTGTLLGWKTCNIYRVAWD